jgi:hypothetical protein
MIATRTSELLRHLEAGSFDDEDTAILEQTSAAQLVHEFRSVYRLMFQERRIGNKWELSLARSVRAELVIRPIPDVLFVSLLWVPAYLNCLMLNIEGDSLTGISRFTRLTVWAVKKPEQGLALRTGRGFKLDRTPDGWAIKPLRKRTVKLSEGFLRERGWRFDHLKQIIPGS